MKWIYFDEERSKYFISNYGNVYTTDFYGKTGKFVQMKTHIGDVGYPMINLNHNGISHMLSVHRLVAMYFVPNPDKLSVVNHIDGNKANNHHTNLEWVTSKENTHHAVDTGLLPVGEKARLAKITEKVAKAICEELQANNLTFKEIMKKYNTTYNTIYDIYRRKSWKQLSINYDFSNYTKDGRYLFNDKEGSTTTEKKS